MDTPLMPTEAQLVDFHTHRPTAEGVFTPRCFGIHPWHAATEQVPSVADERWRTAQVVGECGLDAVAAMGGDLAIQHAAFERQLAIAEQLHKPVVVHCVRCQQQVLQLRRRYCHTQWVLHGFVGGYEQARQLLSHGIEVSFGAAILDARRGKPREALQKLGAGNFLLETDDSGADIALVYREAAELLGVAAELLTKKTAAKVAAVIGAK